MATHDEYYQSSILYIAWTKKQSLRVFHKTKISYRNTPRGDFLNDKTELMHVPLPPKAKRPGPPSSKAGDLRKGKRVSSFRALLPFYGLGQRSRSEAVAVHDNRMVDQSDLS